MYMLNITRYAIHDAPSVDCTYTSTLTSVYGIKKFSQLPSPSFMLEYVNLVDHEKSTGSEEHKSNVGAESRCTASWWSGGWRRGSSSARDDGGSGASADS